MAGRTEKDLLATLKNGPVVIYEEAKDKPKGENQDLKARTRSSALLVNPPLPLLPTTQVQQSLGTASTVGTSVGAHYREAQCSRSTAEFVSKLDGGRQELEETMYWLELLRDSGPNCPDLEPIYAEAKELMAILTPCARNAKVRRNQS